MRKLNRAHVLMATAIAALGVTPLRADLSLNFNGFMVGGQMFYPGQNLPAQGVLGGPFEGYRLYGGANQLQYFFIGQIDFWTGQPTGATQTRTQTGALIDWMFAPGGSLSAFGYVAWPNATDALTSRTTLLTATFSGPSVLRGSWYDPGSNFLDHFYFTGPVTASINPQVLNLFGLPLGPYSGQLRVVTGGGWAPYPPQYPVGCGSCIDLVYLDLVPVPEPRSWLLLLTVLALGAAMASRANRAKRSDSSCE